MGELKHHSNVVIYEIRQELSKYRDRKCYVNAQQFHKEKLKHPWVLKTPIMYKVSAQFYKEVKHMPKKQIFALCEQLLQSGESVEKHIAFDWASRCHRQYEKSDFRRFETWLKRHVSSWGSCDHLCGGPLGHLVFQYPELVSKTEHWVKSRNIWLRRGAAVVLIYALRQRQQLSFAFRMADALLKDKEDLVQKGYGWMLKEASNQYPNEVFRYVMRHKREMPRTALRYAVEKLPPAMRRQAMKKDWQ